MSQPPAYPLFLPLATAAPKPLPPARPSERASGDAFPEFMASLVALLPQIKGCARHLCARPADAEDLAQETCRRAIEAHAQFAPGSNLRAWLLCILRNLHRDGLRRSWREISLGDDIDKLPATAAAERQPPAWTVVSDEETELALTSLPPVFRSTYMLYAVSGLSYSEIAEQLRISCATVGTRLCRARARLRSFLLQRAGIDSGLRANGSAPSVQPST